jgi:hypothetical protein
MTHHRKFFTALAIATCSASLAASGVAIADPPATHAQKPAKATKPAHTPKAFGKLCRAESKKHVKGQKGTPFSQCVTAMAHLANGTSKSPAKACSTLSKKHVKGMKRTPFAACVVAAAQLHKTTPGS